MIETVQTNYGIDEQGFRYYARMKGYKRVKRNLKTKKY